MGRIFLTSCGLKDKEQSDKLFETLKPSLKGKAALVIINATTTGHNERAIEPTNARLTSAGASVKDLVLAQENLDEIDHADVVYVVGGDLNPLLEIVNKIDVKDKIMGLLRRGGIYIGESAGSIITGKSAKWYYDIKKNTSDRYKKVPKLCSGLGLNDYKIFPHFDKASDEMRQIIDTYEKENSVTITRLSDGEFIEIK